VTCRQEVLQAARRLAAHSPDAAFTPAQVVAAMQAAGTQYPASTIRTHVVASMCVDANDNHPVAYPDLRRVGRGRYRLTDYSPNPRDQSASGPATPTVAKENSLPADSSDGFEGAEAVELSGDSRVQREAEAVMVSALGLLIGTVLVPRTVVFADGSRVELDAFSEDPLIAAEVWAHQGPPKSAQRNKVLADALKLHHVARTLGGQPRLVLCFSDDEAAAPFHGRSWYSGALRDLGIEVSVVPLPDEWRQRILLAQKAQYR